MAGNLHSEVRMAWVRGGGECEGNAGLGESADDEVGRVVGGEWNSPNKTEMGREDYSWRRRGNDEVADEWREIRWNRTSG